MKIVCLDIGTLGNDLNISEINTLGDVSVFDSTPPDEVEIRSTDAEIIILNKVKICGKLLSRLPKLRLICVTATGTDNIDLAACKRAGVEVKNVKGYSTDSVAQHTFSILFYLLSNSRYYDEYTKSKAWADSSSFTHLDRPFTELKGKRWGIIGLGEIGSTVAKIASAFGAQVIYYSTSGKNSNTKYKRLELNDLLKTSDIISIHAPLNERTKNLITTKELELISKRSYLLNLGRGGIINENDLAHKIENSTLSVGLDVLESEPLDPKSPLSKVLGRANFYLTPHIAWASIEARETLFNMTLENIRNYRSS